jgi:hypothetical protein
MSHRSRLILFAFFGVQFILCAGSLLWAINFTGSPFYSLSPSYLAMIAWVDGLAIIAGIPSGFQMADRTQTFGAIFSIIIGILQLLIVWGGSVLLWGAESLLVGTNSWIVYFGGAFTASICASGLIISGLVHLKDRKKDKARAAARAGGTIA